MDGEKLPHSPTTEPAAARLDTIKRFLIDTSGHAHLPVPVSDMPVSTHIDVPPQEALPLEALRAYPDSGAIQIASAKPDIFGLLEGINEDEVFCARVANKAQGIVNTVAQNNRGMQRSLRQGKRTIVRSLAVSKQHEPPLHFRLTAKVVPENDEHHGYTAYAIERSDANAKSWQGFSIICHNKSNTIVAGTDLEYADLDNIQSESPAQVQRRRFEVADVWLDAIAHAACVDTNQDTNPNNKDTVVLLADWQREKRRRRNGILARTAASVAALVFGIAALNHTTNDESTPHVTAYSQPRDVDTVNKVTVNNSTNAVINIRNNTTVGDLNTTSVDARNGDARVTPDSSPTVDLTN